MPSWFDTAATTTGALAAVAAFLYTWVNGEVAKTMSGLEDRASLPRYRDLLADSRWSTRYRTTLDRALARADTFFGAPFGGRAFSLCWLIAFVYPLALFVLTWAFGGPNTLGSLTLLPKGWADWQRVALTVMLIAYTYGAFQTLRHAEQIEAWFNHRFASWLPGGSLHGRAILWFILFCFTLSFIAYLSVNTIHDVMIVLFSSLAIGIGTLYGAVPFAGCVTIAEGFAIIASFILAGAKLGAFGVIFQTISLAACIASYVKLGGKTGALIQSPLFIVSLIIGSMFAPIVSYIEGAGLLYSNPQVLW